MTREQDEWKIPQEEPGLGQTDAPDGDSDGVDRGELTPDMQITSLREQLEAALASAANYRDEVQYKEAELQTERRRSAEKRVEDAKYRDEDLLRDLLPAIEGLDLALNAPVSDQWGDGVKLAVREMKRRLEIRGINLINAAEGQPFDPNEHDAIGAEESAEHPPGHIVQAVRGGYRLHDRVIQPAQVIVATERHETEK